MIACLIITALLRVANSQNSSTVVSRLKNRLEAETTEDHGRMLQAPTAPTESPTTSAPTNSPTSPGWPQYYYMAPGQNCPEMTSRIASVMANDPYNPCPEHFPYMAEYDTVWWCRDDPVLDSGSKFCHMSVSGWPVPPGGTWGTTWPECGLSVYESYDESANGETLASGNGRHDILDEDECITAFQALFPDQAGSVTFAGHYNSPNYPRGCAWADHADFNGLHVLINYHAHGTEYDIKKRCCDIHVKYGTDPTVTWGGLTHQADRDWYNNAACNTRMGGISAPECDFHTAICKNYDWEFPDDLYAPLFDPNSPWVDYNSDGCGPQGSSYTGTAECQPHIADGISYITVKEPLVQISPAFNDTQPIVKLIRHDGFFPMANGTTFCTSSPGCCYVRMPSGCDNNMVETDSPMEWFQDTNTYPTTSAQCSARLTNYNNWCGRTDGIVEWVVSNNLYNPCPSGRYLVSWNKNYWCGNGLDAWCMMDESGWPPPAGGQWGISTNNFDVKCTGYAAFDSSSSVCAFFDWTVYHCRVTTNTAAPTSAPTNPTNEPTASPSAEPTTSPTDSPTMAPTIPEGYEFKMKDTSCSNHAGCSVIDSEDLCNGATHHLTPDAWPETIESVVNMPYGCYASSDMQEAFFNTDNTDNGVYTCDVIEDAKCLCLCLSATDAPTTESPTFDPNVYWQLNEFYPKTDGTCTEACNKHVANSHVGVESDDPNVCGSETFPY